MNLPPSPPDAAGPRVIALPPNGTTVAAEELHVHLVLASDAGSPVRIDDGEDGLQRMQEVRPDLLITDINMPKMDGFQLIEAVRVQNEFRGVPILVLSTEFSEEKKARARAAGATGWITKPFDAGKLTAAIRKVCP